MKGLYHIIPLLLICFVIPWQCNKIQADEIVSFTDEDLLQALLDQGYDRNEDGLISTEEADAVNRLELIMKDITNTADLDFFPNLDSLIMRLMPLNELQLSGNRNLRYLECTIGELSKLDLSSNVRLEEIICEYNVLDTLILPKSSDLTLLRCAYNQLRELDVSGNPGLKTLTCKNNLLTTLDLSGNTALTKILCCGNQLTFLDVSSNINITYLGIDNMPSLTRVCVWTLPFPPDGVDILMGLSPNVVFVTDCDN